MVSCFGLITKGAWFCSAEGQIYSSGSRLALKGKKVLRSPQVYFTQKTVPEKASDLILKP